MLPLITLFITEWGEYVNNPNLSELSIFGKWVARRKAQITNNFYFDVLVLNLV